MILEVCKFSGRPNPRFRLSPEEEREIENLLTGNTRGPFHPILGYRGIIIHESRAHICPEGKWYVRRESPLEAYCLKLVALKEGEN